MGGAISSGLLAVSCFTASVASINALGPSAWAYGLLPFGVGFAVAPYFEQLRYPARLLAMFAGVISIFAGIFILLAATTGGSFRITGDQVALLAAIFAIGVFGIATGVALSGTNDAT